MTAIAEGAARRAALRRSPPEPPGVVQRPDLFARLEEGLDGRLVLLTGAPGSGKTVLLTTWLAGRPALRPAAWMSLQLSDGHLVRFWTEFAELVGSAGDRSLSGWPQPGRSDFEAALAAACEDLPTRTVVVLDDFEQLRSWRIIEGLDRFLQMPQTKVCVVIASRRDPGLSLQRLRLAGEMFELRSPDLAFTVEQAHELFTLAGVQLHDDQVAKLHERTEGWVGGLRLAALSLSAHPDPDAFVRGFAGDERTVADYLMEEVLHQQPAAVRQFMLRTSIVDELEPDLVNALTGSDDGGEALAMLERSNAFLVPLDDRRQRYRYHSMFLELLRSQLTYRMPDVVAIEHRRAARWYSGRDRPASAVRHAMAAGDDQAAAELLSERWLTLIGRGRGEELDSWIEGLGQDAVAGNAELAVAGAGAALSAGDLERADGYLALADARVPAVTAQRRARFALSRAVVSMLRARLVGDHAATRHAARKVLAGRQHSDLPDDIYAVAQVTLGVAEFWEADRAGIERLEEALELARRAFCDYVVVDCLAQLALFHALGGSLRDAAYVSSSVPSAAIGHGLDEQPVAAPAYLAMAIVRLHRGDFDGAGEQLERALRVGPPGPAPVTHSLIDLVRAQLIARADPIEGIRIAYAVAQECERLCLPARVATMAAFNEAILAADAGQLKRARAAVSRGDLARRAPVEHAVVMARLHLVDSQPMQALEQLQSDETCSATALHPATRIEATALAAICRHQLNDDAKALALVEEALALAQPEHYRLPLLAVGSPLRELLKRCIRAGTAYRGLAGELIEELDSGGPAGASQRPLLLLDPLSEREEAVLRYLPTVMSKAEIASELFVSVNTVKTHTKSIYRKLGVGTRIDAVRRARMLRLV